MKNSLRIHKWTHNEFNIFILGVLTHPQFRIKQRLVINRPCIGRTQEPYHAMADGHKTAPRHWMITKEWLCPIDILKESL